MKLFIVYKIKLRYIIYKLREHKYILKAAVHVNIVSTVTAYIGFTTEYSIVEYW